MSKENEQTKSSVLMTRRQFFTRPLSWLFHAPPSSGMEEHVPHRMPLTCLDELPENVLMGLTPVLRHGWSSRVCDDGVLYMDPSHQEGKVWLGPEGCAAARMFDGFRTLAQAAAALEKELDMVPGSGGPIVRSVFLDLAFHEVYHPGGPLNLPPVQEGVQGE